MLIEHYSPQLMAINFETPFQQVLQQQRPLLRSFNKEKNGSCGCQIDQC